MEDFHVLVTRSGKSLDKLLNLDRLSLPQLFKKFKGFLKLLTYKPKMQLMQI